MIRSEKGTIGTILSKSSYWYGSLALYVHNTVMKVRSQNLTHRPSYKPLNLPGLPTTSNQFFEKMGDFSLLPVLSVYTLIT